MLKVYFVRMQTRALILYLLINILSACNMVFQPANKPHQEGKVTAVKVRYHKGVQSEIPEIIPGQRIRVDTEAGLRLKMRFIAVEHDTLFGEINKGTVPIAVEQVKSIRDINSRGTKAGISIGIVGGIIALIGVIAFAVLISQGF